MAVRALDERASMTPSKRAIRRALVGAIGTSAMAGYLFSHPDVNNFFTGLRGLPNAKIHGDAQNYLNANPPGPSSRFPHPGSLRRRLCKRRAAEYR
jgi:hemophore-related protein